MPRDLNLLLAAALGVIGASAGCSADGTASAVGESTTGDSIPAVFTAFSSAVTISRDGNYVVLQTNDVPDHKSPYFATTDSRYTPYTGSNSNFALNPNRIAAQQFTFRIPVAPVVSANHSATPLGPIGIATNGVAIFNQYNAGSQPLTVEINSFDQYNGHPQQTGVYHYHVEPTWLTAQHGADALLGFLLDGFPVYGPMENGKKITNADLDTYHGHVGSTKEYPAGIYHYHVTSEDPYINGAGFYGTPGTVAQ